MKISQQEPWKTQLDEARALNEKEQSPTRRALGLLAVAIMEDVINASFALDYEGLHKCAEDLDEIYRRLGGTEPPELSREQVIDETLNKHKELTAYGWRSDLATAFVKGWLKPPPRRKGAPLNARVRSINARDLRQMTPQKSWLEIVKTKGICDCGKRQHDKHCVDKIRMGVRDLDKFIASYYGP
jgi:hypothetical protein